MAGRVARPSAITTTNAKPPKRFTCVPPVFYLRATRPWDVVVPCACESGPNSKSDSVHEGGKRTLACASPCKLISTIYVCYLKDLLRGCAKSCNSQGTYTAHFDNVSEPVRRVVVPTFRQQVRGQSCYSAASQRCESQPACKYAGRRPECSASTA